MVSKARHLQWSPPHQEILLTCNIFETLLSARGTYFACISLQKVLVSRRFQSYKTQELISGNSVRYNFVVRAEAFACIFLRVVRS